MKRLWPGTDVRMSRLAYWFLRAAEYVDGYNFKIALPTSQPVPNWFYDFEAANAGWNTPMLAGNKPLPKARRPWPTLMGESLDSRPPRSICFPPILGAPYGLSAGTKEAHDGLWGYAEKIGAAWRGQLVDTSVPQGDGDSRETSDELMLAVIAAVTGNQGHGDQYGGWTAPCEFAKEHERDIRAVFANGKA